MKSARPIRTTLALAAGSAPLFFASPAFADTPGVHSVESFIKSLITVLVTIGGLTAVVFIVIGGIIYITSAGNPEQLERGKRTLLFSAIGLSITIGGYVLVNIVTSLATGAFGNGS